MQPGAHPIQIPGCPAHKITVSPCGVDPSAFEPSQRDPGQLLAVGQFVAKKSPPSALHMDMVGDGPLLAEARAFAALLGPAVTLHRALPHAAVRALTAHAMVFLQHSATTPDGDCDGPPTPIPRAMSAEIPVASTRHSGLPEWVEHGIHGLLVTEHDVQGMADATAILASDPALRARMGKAGRATIVARCTNNHTVKTLR